MKNARELHHEAMNKLHDAEVALEKGNYPAHLVLLTEASNIEAEAAYLLRDKFQAEPTRSVLFRSAANLALRCREFKKAERLVLTALTGNVPQELKSEMLDVFSEALAGNAQNLPEVVELYGGQEYVNALRKKSLSFKVVSKGTSNAVRMDHAISVLRNVRTSYTNYSLANYRRSFGDRNQNDKFGKLMRQSAAEELLIADLKHASFGFSIAVDTFMMKGLTVEMSEWKTKTFSAFEHEVINLDYNSIDIAQEVADKYTKEELRAVYGPIVSMLNTANGYVVATTNSEFTEVKRVLTPVKKAVSTIVFPKLIQPGKDLRMVQAIGLAEIGSDIQKDNILGVEEVNYIEFTRTFDIIKFEKSALYFKEPYSIKIEYNTGVFSIDSVDFDFKVESTNHRQIFEDFSKNIIALYSELRSSDYEELSIDDKAMYDKLEGLISMSALD
jgi:hypothetical protein